MSTHISRRAMLASGAAGAIALSLPSRWAGGADWKRYADAIVIDGLGEPGSITAEPSTSLSDAHIKDVRDSGLTCLHASIQPVVTTTPDTAFTEAVRGIISWEHEIDIHPDVFARVRKAAAIPAAKNASRP